MKKEYKMSAARQQELQDELTYLKTVREKEVAELIKEARGFGDLSENSEYDEAKNEQAKIEDHITQLENMLRIAVVVDHTEVSSDKVSVGCRVKIHDEATGFETEYKIVGATEADPLEGLISNESPVGAALLGKKEGEDVTIAVPDGMRTLKVLAITKD